MSVCGGARRRPEAQTETPGNLGPSGARGQRPLTFYRPWPSASSHSPPPNTQVTTHHPMPDRIRIRGVVKRGSRTAHGTNARCRNQDRRTPRRLAGRGSGCRVAHCTPGRTRISGSLHESYVNKPYTECLTPGLKSSFAFHVSRHPARTEKASRSASMTVMHESHGAQRAADG